MTVLSDTEKLILEANRRYQTTRDKVLYVNAKLKTIDALGNRLKNAYGSPDPNWVGQAEFYRKLGSIAGKLAMRTGEVAKNLLPRLLEQRDEYEKQLNDTLSEIDTAKADHNFLAVAALRRFYFDYSAYLSSLEEEIQTYFDRGGLVKYEKTTKELTATV